MKTTDKQKLLCDIIISQANAWKNSNDINSPTHMSDIDEEFYSNDINLDDEKYMNVYNKLYDLYWAIRELEY